MTLFHVGLSEWLIMNCEKVKGLEAEVILWQVQTRVTKTSQKVADRAAETGTEYY